MTPIAVRTRARLSHSRFALARSRSALVLVRQGAVECTVTATPQGGGSPVTSTVGHPLSYPTTSVELHNLKADSVYEIAVRCKGDDGKEEAASNDKALHTTKSDAHPGVVNLHPTSPTSVAFHIVAPKASECDAEKYDVFIGRPGGSTSKTTVSQVDVSLSGLAPNTKYEVAVDAVCKGGSVSKKSAPAFVTTTPTPTPPTPTPGPTVLDKAPTFHTITVFGPHPEVSVYLNGTVPTGATVVIDVACADGFKSSVSAPASVPETTLHLSTGLPPGTTCTYTAYTANGSKKSPTATEQRIVPSSALESPSLVSWTPDFRTKGGTVTVVAPQAINCTGGIVEYTVTGTESSGTSVVGRKRHLLQSPAFSVTSSVPATVTIANGVSYNSGTPTLDMEVVGKCADGSLTPSGHLSVNLASCPAISNCATLDDAGGSCQCKTCAPGFDLATTGYVCTTCPLPSNCAVATCTNAGDSTCTQCMATYVLSGGACVPDPCASKVAGAVSGAGNVGFAVFVPFSNPSGGDIFAAGEYEIQYGGGCMKYSRGGQGWTVNAMAPVGVDLDRRALTLSFSLAPHASLVRPFAVRRITLGTLARRSGIGSRGPTSPLARSGSRSAPPSHSAPDVLSTRIKTVSTIRSRCHPLP